MTISKDLAAALKSILVVIVCLWVTGDAYAHEVSKQDTDLIAGREGWHLILYAWLGAKHMLTGYDHLLFLLGVIFYLRDVRGVLLLVSLFAVGHTLTLIGGVLFRTDINSHLVDAIIGLSVAYKGFDNLGGFDEFFGDSPDEKVAVFLFGLFHGLGLATKLQTLSISEEGLLANLLSFNVGVEVGQILALAIIVLVLRVLPNRVRGSIVSNATNVFLLVAGFALMAKHVVLYLRA